MIFSGNLRKMHAELAKPVQYNLVLNEQHIPLNPHLGKRFRLSYQAQINCIHCGRLTKKSFNQGYCYPCFTRLAQCDSCIMKPEQCHFEAGTCREPAWAEQFCFQDHYVYLSNTSGVKVGITRGTQIPTRWIDQGAIQALPIIRVPSRYASGLVEVAFKEHVSDKTAWQRMLKGAVEPIDLIEQREQLIEQCLFALDDISQQFGATALEVLDHEKSITIEYPLLQNPNKIKSLNLDKTPEIEGILQGIKGQYLLFDSGVINLRKFSGYQITLEIDE